MEPSGAASPADALVGAIEAGGTKFRVALAKGRELVDDTTIPTTTPDETLGATLDFLTSGEPPAAVGIASFGPLDLDPGSPGYGSIVATPKPGWTDTPVRARVAEALQVPVTIDVDVNGAALAEWLWGAAEGVESLIYITIGTGIGGGLLIEGTPRHGMGHPEMGHIVLERIPGDDFPGRCPFHGNCFEGMAAGPAISDRWGAPVHTLHDRAEVWELEAGYVGQALRSLVYVAAPQRIVLGGGVMHHEGLLQQVRNELTRQLADYAPDRRMLGPLDEFLVAPGFGQDAGLYGAVALAFEGLRTAGAH